MARYSYTYRGARRNKAREHRNMDLVPIPWHQFWQQSGWSFRKDKVTTTYGMWQHPYKGADDVATSNL